MRAKIIAALKANPNASAVARQLGGVSRHTVGEIARKAGIRLAAATATRRVVTPEQRAKIIAALKTNPNARAVARQVEGVSSNTIGKIARQVGIRLAAATGERRVVTPEQRAKIIAALKANPNARAVARQLGGISAVTVWKIARQVGIDLAAAEAARRVVTPERRAKIIAALKANPNARSVARQVGGVSGFTVGKIAKKTGIDLAAAKAARRALPPERRAKIIAALKANPNARAVARQVEGVSYATVKLIAKQTGIELTAGQAAKGNRQSRLSEEKRTQIIAALKANPNASAVAKQVGGVSSQTIRKIAKKTGIDLAAAKAARFALAPEKRAKIIAALEANPNAAAVTRQVGGGVCRATVRE